ncbi:PREDICTED: zinc fingers and homeoboxes protein 1 [Elephantulus edwardii]|uniref:zinc fingers and homeoboxes protein 1 n=1 Tax=Elephantulus edwardii TaxID=28737 RepID=UPI0003F08660|nr:PREDICTED: zinc fingers and homeoboxes protein 1 [Elephantulus edwardii]
MASRRKSTTPCMVLSSDQDPDLELISDLDEGPPVLTPVENTKTESISSDEEIHGSVDSDNQPKKVEGGYECKYCTFQTPDLNMFTFHVDSEHPTVVLNSSYVCVECNFLTKRYDALSEHNLKYHPGEENFKLTMVKRNNQTIFEQTVNDLTFDGSFVKEENSEQAESADAPSSGISISKTPIMKMMKNKVENKRITVHHNSAEEAPEEKENDIKPDREDAVENPSSSASDSSPSSSVVNRIHPTPAHTVVSPAAVLPGLAQVITAMSAQQNSNLIPKVLIPVNSIPSYNTALDNNPLLLNTYNKFPYPTVSEIAVLSAQAKYTEEQIKIWFSAQRLKHGVSWTPEEVEEARRKQFNGALHSVPQTITVIPTHISPASNGLPSILQTCQIVGQPGLVLTQVAGANPLPVSAPIALTVAGVPNQTSVQKSQVPAAAQPVAEAKPPAAATATVTTVTAAAGPASQLVKPESTPPNPANPDSLGIRAKKTKEQLAELKVSYLQSQFPPDAEITRLMKITGLTKGEIKKWFSDTRYNQRNAKGHQGPSLGSDPAAPIVIDSSDETAESSPGGDRALPLIKFKTGTAILKDYYVKHKFLNEQDLDELVNRSHMGYEQVREWFAERQRRAELGLELFEEEEEEDEEPEEGLDEQEEEDDEETDDSDTWEPPRHVKRKLSKSDD